MTPTSTTAEEDLFYENSRQNIALLLIFWLSYILAYLLVARFVPLVSPKEGIIFPGYVRKRRSNLSRLMLLERRPKSRPQSVPPQKAFARDNSVNESKLTRSSSIISSDFSDTTCTEGDNVFFAVTSPFENEPTEQLIGKHILSSFSLSFTVSVVGTSLAIQGILIVPCSILGLHYLKQPFISEWPWLTKSLLQEWWKYLWYSAIFCLFVAIPFNKLISETKVHRDDPLFKRLKLILMRFWAYCKHYRLILPSIFTSTLIFLLILAGSLGLLEPIRWSQWLLLGNAFILGFTSLSLLLGIPSGFMAIVKYFIERIIWHYRARKDINSKLAIVTDEIDKLNELFPDEGTTSNLKKRKISIDGEETPISSKSFKAKLKELQMLKDSLISSQQNTSLSKWKSLGWAILFLFFGLLMSFFIINLTLNWIFFIWKFVISYTPGLLLISKIFRTNVVDSNTSNYSLEMFLVIFMQLLHFYGIYSILTAHNRQRTSIGLTTVPSKSSLNIQNFLLPLSTLIFSIVLSAPSIALSGVLHYEKQSFDYLPIIMSLFPSSCRQLMTSLGSIKFFHFPLFLWLLIAFRFILLLLLLPLYIGKVKLLMRSLKHSFL